MNSDNCRYKMIKSIKKCTLGDDAQTDFVMRKDL